MTLRNGDSDAVPFYAPPFASRSPSALDISRNGEKRQATCFIRRRRRGAGGALVYRRTSPLRKRQRESNGEKYAPAHASAGRFIHSSLGAPAALCCSYAAAARALGAPLCLLPAPPRGNARRCCAYEMK